MQSVRFFHPLVLLCWLVPLVSGSWYSLFGVCDVFSVPVCTCMPALLQSALVHVSQFRSFVVLNHVEFVLVLA